MGCGASNSANAAVEPVLNNQSGPEASHQSTNPNRTARIKGTNENENYDTATSNDRVPYSNGSAGPMNGTSQTANFPSPTKVSPAEIDPRWKELWLAHKDILLDPADVHATLQDLMANATNRLSDAEILFLQRMVRSIVRQSHLQTEQQSSSNGGKNRKKTKRSGGSTSGNSTSGIIQELQDTNFIAKNHHLLTSYVLRKVLPKPPVPMANLDLEFLASNFTQNLGSLSGFESSIADMPSGDNSVSSIGSVSSGLAKNSTCSIRTTETTYLLALFCNDVLWDNVAEIAVDSAKANDLEMDVNRIVNRKDKSSNSQNNYSNFPQIPVPTCERTPEIPLGMGMHALTFLLGLALRT